MLKSYIQGQKLRIEQVLQKHVGIGSVDARVHQVPAQERSDAVEQIRVQHVLTLADGVAGNGSELRTQMGNDAWSQSARAHRRLFPMPG